ncbi:unnamed protein product [Brassica oleracea var. botrytis]|uniref:DUF7806 domain-containing protein n=2 Tax=Brassica TaxID=3705 RepID=A0A3P6ELX6_BRAOL|nr:uncharacterized protein LOC106425159 [Brassica napus]XP_022559427.1 uncharacterized protein LOC106425159 [Brassica napus]XP_048612848.1 uncharacterized protein LOC125586949 [Brassica napus]VDD45617.1 unnamed protein product [Brassica oleracea]KAH0854060.1 hypothetical protein HID58_092639 [Brassica napus]KAH0880185.1 hypothetical protein HID58_067579 [Brassica napus]CAF1932302.1 unnamed protein product [Brassica napus]
MEALYAKLYNKYTTLKERKFSELDEVNKKQEEKFLRFVDASEALTQHLRSEDHNSKEIIRRMRDEITEIRSARHEERLEFQNRLAEEERKNKALSEQVEKLKELISEGVPQSGRKQKTPESPQVTTRSMGKRRRLTEDDMVETDMVSPHVSIPHESTTETLLVSQPQCPKTADVGSSSSTGSPFQALSEQLTGMKLSTNNEGERVCIIASHPSSGLSFSLTLVDNSTGEEAELLYNVVSLGTFERVVPNWMRDVIKFNTSMTPLFFERVSRVIKPRD